MLSRESSTTLVNAVTRGEARRSDGLRGDAEPGEGRQNDARGGEEVVAWVR